MRLNVEIKTDIYERLSRAADGEGRSISDVVRVMVLGYVRKREREENGGLNERGARRDDGGGSSRG